tara:strand:+ start:83839 stop:84588 length:750 start_codon:yes stop_codon:yes gene_type:complete
VKQLQFLSTSDTVQLSDSGYLILVHHSGLFLEFDQDTTISVSELALQITDQLNIVPRDIKARAAIQLLFSNKPGIRYWATGPVERNSYSPVWFSIPSSRSIDISPNKPELCVSWRCSDLKEHEAFIVQVKNIFDENIWELEVDGTSITLDLSQQFKDNRLLIVNVRDRNDSTFRSSGIGIKLGPEYFYTPRACELMSPVKALEMGYYLESSSYGIDATKYYKLAAELSDRPIFDEFLRLYKKRDLKRAH